MVLTQVIELNFGVDFALLNLIVDANNFKFELEIIIQCTDNKCIVL